MTKKKMTARTTRPASSTHQHAHGEGHCLDILRQLSDYIDDELPSDICAEIRRHLGACPNCEVFVSSLRQTVTLCRHHPTSSLTPADRTELRQAVLRTARRKPR